MDFDSLVLSRSELKNLRRLLKSPAENNSEWEQRLSTLCDLGFAEFAQYPGDNGKLAAAYFITDEGKRYLSYLKRRKSEMRFANTMSVLALLVSVIALIVSIVR